MTPPALLVSFVCLNNFLKYREEYVYREWVMDSGAFSAFTSGVVIDLQEYIDRSAELLRTDPTLKHVFALDVIGDPEGTLRNTEEMWRQGVPAVPCFHYGSPWHYLTDMAKTYTKIALGGVVARGAGGHGVKLTYLAKLTFVEGYFSRVWPHWIHGFGCCDRRLLARIPFAAVDSTTWLYGPARYGKVASFVSRGKVLPTSVENPGAFAAGVRTQVAFHSEIEDNTRGRFGKILAQAGLGQFTLHLATSGEPDAFR